MNTQSNKGRNLLVLMEIGCTYRELLRLIEKLPAVRLEERDEVLPPEIIEKIASFLTVVPVVPVDVVAVRASSSDGSHTLQDCLSTDKSTWWISSFGSMPNGKGEEFVEFRLSSKPCRLRSVSIEIPPLPMGPLSVRTMKVKAKIGDFWEEISPIYKVENKTGWQKYDIPPVDTQLVRLVCLTNQISQFLPTNSINEQDFRQFAAVGYFSVKFE